MPVSKKYKHWWTIKQLAKFLGFHRVTIESWIHKGAFIPQEEIIETARQRYLINPAIFKEIKEGEHYIKTNKEAAQYLQLTVWRFNYLVDTGHIPYIELPKRQERKFYPFRWFSLSELNAYKETIARFKESARTEGMTREIVAQELMSLPEYVCELIENGVLEEKTFPFAGTHSEDQVLITRESVEKLIGKQYGRG